MGATFIHRGEAIDYTPGSAVAAGDVVLQEELVGVAKLDISANTLGSLHVSGVFDFPKDPGMAEEIPVGTKVYWDGGTGFATKTVAGAEKLIGKAVAYAADTDEKVRVRLNQ